MVIDKMTDNKKNKLKTICVVALAGFALGSNVLAEEKRIKDSIVQNPYLYVQTGAVTNGDLNNKAFFGGDVFGKVAVNGSYSVNNLTEKDSSLVLDMALKTGTIFQPLVRETTLNGHQNVLYGGIRVNLEGVFSNTNCNSKLVSNFSDRILSHNVCVVSLDEVKFTNVYALNIKEKRKPSHYIESEASIAINKSVSFYVRGEDLLSKDKRKALVGFSYSF